MYGPACAGHRLRCPRFPKTFRYVSADYQVEAMRVLCPIFEKHSGDYLWLAEQVKGSQGDYRHINGEVFCCEDTNPPTKPGDHLPVIVRLDLENSLSKERRRRMR